MTMLPRRPHVANARLPQPTPEVGELLQAWVGIRLDEVDDLVDEARSKVAALPDQRALWSLFGELLLEVRGLAHEVAELKRGQR